jgi:hypothetical protein
MIMILILIDLSSRAEEQEFKSDEWQRIPQVFVQKGLKDSVLINA